MIEACIHNQREGQFLSGQVTGVLGEFPKRKKYISAIDIDVDELGETVGPRIRRGSLCNCPIPRLYVRADDVGIS